MYVFTQPATLLPVRSHGFMDLALGSRRQGRDRAGDLLGVRVD